MPRVSKRASAAPRRPEAEDPRFARVVAAFAGDEQIDRGTMFGSPGLKVGGKVFAMLVMGELVVKLPGARVDAVVASGTGNYFDPGHGRLMKQWVAIGGGAAPSWVVIAREACAFVKEGKQ